MAKRIQIDIVSDTVCPWCFIGKRRLETAIKSYQERNGPAEFQVKWHAYQLNPGASEEGVNKRAFYKEKFGSSAPSLIENMKETFAREGLAYNIDGLTGNTFNSHRLISYAGKLGPTQQNILVEQLFKAYFTEAKFINDKKVLLEAAKSAGIPDAEKVLSDDNLEKLEVQAEIRGSRGRINGVPHFTINNQYSLSGAQDPQQFLEIFGRV